ncbi:hypothetical protein GCM10019016_016890 [Streptomyces prasinosporus]|uniref:Uncharacterized protein n=1 Tax=Streptomyces prasinosporus TaxID=68256 RepID=A0ABP6TIG7_9ACTN
MGDDDGHALGGDPLGLEEDGVLTAGIHPGGRLVQDQQWCLPVRGASAHEALPLPSGRFGAAPQLLGEKGVDDATRESNTDAGVSE